MNKQTKKDLFYYYHNWKAKMDNRVHLNSCKNCNNGMGMRTNTIKGKNGVWVGPFSTIELALNWATKYSNKPNPIKLHNCIKIK